MVVGLWIKPLANGDLLPIHTAVPWKRRFGGLIHQWMPSAKEKEDDLQSFRPNERGGLHEIAA
jgi:hypothetical protein